MHKKILPIVLILATLSGPLHAQININFGLKGGVNISTVLGEDADKASGLIGPHAGGIVRFSGSEQGGFLTYVIQSELFYSVQGSKPEDGKSTLSYLNLPIMVQRYIASSGFYIETGPPGGVPFIGKGKNQLWQLRY